MFPNGQIVGRAEVQQTRLRGMGKNVRQARDKLVTKIMIEQQLHVA